MSSEDEFEAFLGELKPTRKAGLVERMWNRIRLVWLDIQNWAIDRNNELDEKAAMEKAVNAPSKVVFTPDDFAGFRQRFNEIRAAERAGPAAHDRALLRLETERASERNNASA